MGEQLKGPHGLVPNVARVRIPGAVAGPRVYDRAVTEPAAQEPLSGEAPSPRGRASALGAVAFVLLGVPFLVFGGMMLNLKARVELRCDPGGPCTLFHLSWLGQERVGHFKLEEIQRGTVERNRDRKGAELYRPVLETTGGKFPLSSRWLADGVQAERTVRVVNYFRSNPFGGGGKGFILFHDHRRGPLIVGFSFGSVGLVLLGVSVWLALKARRYSRAERAARTSPSAG
jgi:hypothetical protein